MGTKFDDAVLMTDTVTMTGNVYLPEECVADGQVAANAAIDASKLGHQHRQRYAQESATAAAAEARVVHIARGAGTLQQFKAGVVVACIGNATVTVDLKKNGTTVLTAPVVLDSTNAAYTKEEGTISSAAFVAGDVIEVVVSVSAGTGTLGKGVFAYADIEEAYQ